jgi:hypothetical protein
MSDSTSILDLPSDPSAAKNNIQLTMAEQPPPPQQAMQQPPSQNITLDQTTINQIVRDIQQASASGATMMPSRDIPMNPSMITNDAFIQPNFVPPTMTRNYIHEDESTQDILERYGREKTHSDSLDQLYSEIQTPILLAALYFLFQLPFFRKFLMNYFPVFFCNDGNLNIKGFLFMSILFGGCYHIFNKMQTHMGI